MVRRLRYHGSGLSLFRIQLTNAVLTLLTLGLYFFWGKVEYRRHVLSQTEFEGDRFAYHGTGQEMLRGFVKVVLLFWGPLVLVAAAITVIGEAEGLQAVAAVLVWLVSLVFVPVAMVSVRRYRLSRTSWRGIRFSFRGPVGGFIRLFVVGSLATMVTLGLYYPFFDTRRYGFLTEHSYFGNRRLGFGGTGWALLGPFLLAVLLTVPTVGLCWFWYLARKRRYLWNETSFGTARFRGTMTGWGLFALFLGNAVLLVGTLGLARAWVTVRNLRFTFAHLTLEGPLDLEAIAQEAQQASATGEGLAGLLDTGGFDFG